MDRVYLFVYGTLRKDFGLKLLETVANKIVFTGHGYVGGRMYDLGSYPAAVKTEQHIIKGDVFALSDAGFVFDLFDDYEGTEYQREKTPVSMESGELVEAFIYWYIGKTGKALLIEEADYLKYLKNKKTVSDKWNITP